MLAPQLPTKIPSHRADLVNNDEQERPTTNNNTDKTMDLTDGAAVAPLRPHGWYHPHKTWLDIAMSLLLPLVFTLRALARGGASPEASHEIIAEFRTKFYTFDKGTVTAMAAAWATQMECEGIVEHQQSLPLDPDLLHDWGLIESTMYNGTPSTNTNRDTDTSGNTDETCETVPIVVRYPVSLFQGDSSNESLQQETTTTILADEKTNHGLMKATGPLDLSSIPLDVPIMITFHGGGMNMGDAQYPLAMGTVTSALDGWEKQKQTQGSNKDDSSAATSTATTKPFVVVISVEYRLSPENPFPAAIHDSLTVAKAVLDSHPQRKIHFHGVSAGGNLATVAGLEIFRRYPGRVLSINANSPMFDPACNSDSYYLNSLSSGACPVEYLLWSWRAYLGTDHGVENPSIVQEEPTDGPRGRTNEHIWNDKSSRWRKTLKHRRLIEPYVDLPKGLDRKNAPLFLVSTNKADPLKDDGVRLVRALRKVGAQVRHVDAGGSHVAGNMFDRQALQDLEEGNAALLFGL